MSQANQDAYTVLAQVYDDAGFSDYSAYIIQPLITLLQENGWMGRRVLDLGCGTGAGTVALANLGMDVVGMDANEAMLAVANIRLQDTEFNIELVQGDMRSDAYPAEMDLVLMLGNTLNELHSMKHIEMVFARSFNALAPGRRLVFDMLTLRGLGAELATEAHVLPFSDRLFMGVENYFNYETMTLRQVIHCFRQQPSGWQRDTLLLSLRGYPMAALTGLLEKVGFEVLAIYSTALKVLGSNAEQEGQVLFVVQKPDEAA